MPMKWKRNGRVMNHRELLAYNEKNKKTTSKPVVEKKAPKEEPKTVDVAEASPTEDLEALRASYEVKLGKPAPNAYKNNAEWLKSKLT